MRRGREPLITAKDLRLIGTSLKIQDLLMEYNVWVKCIVPQQLCIGRPVR